MEENEVVPDAIDDVPPAAMEIKFDTTVVNMGNELTPTNVRDVPTYIMYPAEENTLYTIIMIDLDAPSRENPKYSQWQHWLIVNIPGTDVELGTVLTEYVGACPLRGTGAHRYVFLAFKQKGELPFMESYISNREGWPRACFSTRSFVSKYELEGPVAGNFFLAKWDKSVPKLHKQLASD